MTPSPFRALPPDGTWPMGTTRWEKRNIAEEILIWKEVELCTQCKSPRCRLPTLSYSRKSGRRLKRWKTPLPACIRWM
ncbi:hypothetical protein MJK71_13070 [Escherichia coli]|nr:hypothetical protein MJK71_13070 [Escherichia coli]